MKMTGYTVPRTARLIALRPGWGGSEDLRAPAAQARAGRSCHPCSHGPGDRAPLSAGYVDQPAGGLLPFAGILTEKDEPGEAERAGYSGLATNSWSRRPVTYLRETPHAG